MELIVLSQTVCSGCKKLHNKLEELKKESSFEYTEINIDDQPEAVAKYNIMSTPVTILMDEEEEITRVVGYSFKNEEDIEELIDQLD